jgi:hypothetical protein
MLHVVFGGWDHKGCSVVFSWWLDGRVKTASYIIDALGEAIGRPGSAGSFPLHHLSDSPYGLSTRTIWFFHQSSSSKSNLSNRQEEKVANLSCLGLVTDTGSLLPYWIDSSLRVYPDLRGKNRRNTLHIYVRWMSKNSWSSSICHLILRILSNF